MFSEFFQENIYSYGIYYSVTTQNAKEIILLMLAFLKLVKFDSEFT